MHLPIATTIAAAGFLVASQSGSSNRVTNAVSSPASTATLVARQDDTKPPPFVTSITFLTSIAFVTAEPSTSTSPVNYDGNADKYRTTIYYDQRYYDQRYYDQRYYDQRYYDQRYYYTFSSFH
ncbi:uncharacterized protein J4E79_004181 [Alternaria viburni]|uniref:uncharacterized protein n=1 Tax=Alternaria viburni TaxID=566460 RepID=UPI0020C35A59|nr:uncharacterized protein J4E79_004181 [Alternaria viburni]KAI4662870.1 hypothetical protein J4E79_004181 [Alternaria viburni]